MVKEKLAGKYALVNADYEFELYQQELGTTLPERILRNRKMTEFMFFFMNKNEDIGLHAHQNYPQDYLNYLRSLGLVVPHIVQQGPSFNWYGQLKDIPKEKRLNSKLWGYELLNRLALNPTENVIVRNETEIREHVEKNPGNKTWMLKSPYLMAGLNFYQFTAQDQMPDISSPHILEPYFERLLDFALYYCPHTLEKFFYLCKTTSAGRYKGGVIFQDPQGLATHVETLGLTSNFQDLMRDSLKILDVLITEGLEQPLTVDSFLFSTPRGAGHHPGCDINYRQNMGGLLLSLRSFLPNHGVGEFMLMQKIPQLTHNQMTPYSLQNKTGVIYLSPPDSDSLGIFFSARNATELEHMKTFFFYSVQNS